MKKRKTQYLKQILSIYKRINWRKLCNLIRCRSVLGIWQCCCLCWGRFLPSTLPGHFCPRDSAVSDQAMRKRSSILPAPAPAAAAPAALEVRSKNGSIQLYLFFIQLCFDVLNLVYTRTLLYTIPKKVKDASNILFLSLSPFFVNRAWGKQWQ